MLKKHADILNSLMKYSNPTSSVALAKELGISARSVKNYVQEINRNSDLKVIVSTKNGYILNKEFAKALLSKSNSKIPQSYDERSIYIIKQLLVEHSTDLDLYALCDVLYVSYATLKNDIFKMNQTYSTFQISFETQNDILYVKGSEKAKRKLISYILSEEANGKFIDIQILKDSFSNLDIDKLFKITRNIFNKYNYYLNDFSYVNLILHLIIIIDRISRGNTITDIDNSQVKRDSKNTLVRELCMEVEKNFNVKFNKDEFFEIFTLVRANVSYSIGLDDNTIESSDNDVLNILKDIIQKIYENYFIDLSTDSFMTPFTLHIKNLILRLMENSYVKNPLVEAIKNSCPTIYDIAVFFSMQLMKVYNLHINEDEIAFIAFHIGAEIERKQIDKSKIQCAILCPGYFSLKDTLYNKLLFDYGNYINILKVVSFEHELEGLELDLLISTIKTEDNPKYSTILIPPFSFNIDKSMMFDIIEKIQQDTRGQILKANFRNYFNDKLFLHNIDFASKEQIIKMLSQTMLDQGYVDENFTNQVLERERAGSTAFFEIAIPHSVKMEALQTKVSVLISKDGIPWDTHIVHVVFLIAMNKLDRKIFKELYEALVILFNKESVIKLAKNCTSFTDFENIVYTSISNALD